MHDEAEALRSMIEAAHTAQISEDKTKIAEITAENIARKQEFAERRQKRELQEAKERRSVQQVGWHRHDDNGGDVRRVMGGNCLPGADVLT